MRFTVGSRLAAAYQSATGRGESIEPYRCRYALDPELRVSLLIGPLRVAAEDSAGDVWVVELEGHPFVVAMLFQPNAPHCAVSCRPSLPHSSTL